MSQPSSVFSQGSIECGTSVPSFPYWVVIILAGAVLASEAVGQRVPAPDVGYTQGEQSAAVLVVEFLDFGCPTCALFAQETYPTIRDRYVRSGQVRWQTVPFVLGGFRNSAEAARAAACADEQAAFWQMHDLLFAQRNAWSQTRDPDSSLLAFARELGLDEEEFHRCYLSDDARKRVEDQTRVARRSRVRGTPTFLIDGEPALGALDVAEFSRRIEERLEP